MTIEKRSKKYYLGYSNPKIEEVQIETLKSGILTFLFGGYKSIKGIEKQ